MSRCFPYPPPGYTPTRNLDSSLIDSIKRQKEREKRHRERKKEKKDKERRKEKDKAMRHDTDGYIKEKLLSDAKSKLLDETGVEGLESSSLSEEHGQPVMLVVPSSSSDSTDNSINKKRPLSQISGNVTRVLQPRGNSRSIKEHDLRYNREDQSCASLAINEIEQVSDRKPEELHTPVLTEDRSHGANVAKTGSSKRHRAYLQFKDLMESWFPPSLQHHLAPCADNDMEWLFKSTNQKFSRPEQKSATETLPCSSSSSLSWPSAHYLPEVAIYALPYTVPY